VSEQERVSRTIEGRISSSGKTSFIENRSYDIAEVVELHMIKQLEDECIGKLSRFDIRRNALWIMLSRHAVLGAVCAILRILHRAAK
jgi:hypothetical protein